MADVHSKCANCRFFLNAEVMGSCRRYPQTINRHMNDWCGEHSYPKIISGNMNDQCGEQALAIQMYPEPPPKTQIVYDINTDTIKPKRKYTQKEKQ